MGLTGLQIFKYLPAAKKEENSNCKKCGFPTCMAFALKLAKGDADIELCPFVNEELKKTFLQSAKPPQKTVEIGKEYKVKVGGENVLFRHDKTFVNKTAIVMVLDTDANDFEVKLEKIKNYEISRVNEKFKIDAVLLKGSKIDDDLIKSVEKSEIAVILEHDLKDFELVQVDESDFKQSVETLIYTRRGAIKTKDEKYSNPVFLYFKHQDNMFDLCAKASFYICKYANMLIFEDFNEALIATLMTLRQNIFTDPQKPLQVESGIYEFNNPDRDSIVFLTTNFALTYFAVANELEALDVPTYLVVTPSEGMSVLTAWSAEKFTAQIVAKTIKKFDLANKINKKRIIIPGLLAHMQEEIQEAVPDFEITIGTNEAYLIKDFVKNLSK